jgi:hypothetical protein
MSSKIRDTICKFTLLWFYEFRYWLKVRSRQICMHCLTVVQLIHALIKIKLKNLNLYPMHKPMRLATASEWRIKPDFEHGTIIIEPKVAKPILINLI